LLDSLLQEINTRYKQWSMKSAGVTPTPTGQRTEE